MEDKWISIKCDDSKKIRILPAATLYGKTIPYYTMSHVYWRSEEDRKRDLRKRKIKIILDAINI